MGRPPRTASSLPGKRVDWNLAGMRATSGGDCDVLSKGFRNVTGDTANDSTTRLALEARVPGLAAASNRDRGSGDPRLQVTRDRIQARVFRLRANRRRTARSGPPKADRLVSAVSSG